MQEQDKEIVFFQVWDTMLVRNSELYESSRSKLIGLLETKVGEVEECEGICQFEARFKKCLSDRTDDFSVLRETILKSISDLYRVDDLMKKAGNSVKSRSHIVQFFFIVESLDYFDDFASCLLLVSWFGSQIAVLSSRACEKYIQPANSVLVATDLSLFRHDIIEKFQYKLQVVPDLSESSNNDELCINWIQKAGTPTSRISSALQAFFKVPVAWKECFKQRENLKVSSVGAWFEPEKTRKLIKRTGLFIDLYFIEYSSIVDLKLEPDARYDCILYKIKSDAKFQQLSEYVEKQKAAGRKVLLSNDLESFQAFRKREKGIEMLQTIASSPKVQNALNPDEQKGGTRRQMRVPSTITLSLSSCPSIGVAANHAESARTAPVARRPSSFYHQVFKFLQPHRAAGQGFERVA